MPNNLSLLRPPRPDQFWYLGSPYSKYPGGLDGACSVVARLAGDLIRAKVPVFCPIAHSHTIAMIAGIDPGSHEIWLPADEPFMANAYGLIVATMRTWRDSYGLMQEIKRFKKDNKHIVYMDPTTKEWRADAPD